MPSKLHNMAGFGYLHSLLYAGFGGDVTASMHRDVELIFKLLYITDYKLIKISQEIHYRTSVHTSVHRYHERPISVTTIDNGRISCLSLLHLFVNFVLIFLLLDFLLGPNYEKGTLTSLAYMIEDLSSPA